MTFPVHRSEERTPGERGEAFGRAQAGPVAHTLAVYRRMFAETHGVDAREAGAEVRLPDAAREEIAGIARGAEQDELELRAVNARTEILAGAGPTECSVVGAGGLLAQNWDWHPDFARLDRDLDRRAPDGWFATLTEAGMLAKIGLNDAGLGVCLNLLPRPPTAASTARRSTSCCARCSRPAAPSTRRSRCSPRRRSARPRAVTVATPGDVATRRALTRRRERHPRQRRRAHEPLPRAAARRPRHRCPRSRRARSRGWRSSARQPLLDALRSHDGHPKGVCRHLDPDEPWVEQTVTVASVVMNLAALRFHVAAGQPCTHEHVQIALPCRRSRLRPASSSSAPPAATAPR